MRPGANVREAAEYGTWRATPAATIAPMSQNLDPALHVVVPCSLAAAAADAARQGQRFPALESLFAGATISRANHSLEQATAALLGIEQVPVPIAALRLAGAEATAARDGFWLCADPVRVQLSVDNVHIVGRCDDLTPDETAAIVATLNEALGGDGLTFVATDPKQWYVRCAAEQAVSTVPLRRAIGPAIRGLLPRGDAGPRWRTLLNEAQMVLHAHPINVAREDAGRARVGSLWWWGEGRWPTFTTASIDVASGGPAWIASACAMNEVVRGTSGAGEAMRNAAAGKRVLWIVADDWEADALDPVGGLEGHDRMLQPLGAALASRRIAGATLWFADDDATLRAACTPPPRSLRESLRRMTGRDAPRVPLAETLARVPR